MRADPTGRRPDPTFYRAARSKVANARRLRAELPALPDDRSRAIQCEHIRADLAVARTYKRWAWEYAGMSSRSV